MGSTSITPSARRSTTSPVSRARLSASSVPRSAAAVSASRVAIEHRVLNQQAPGPPRGGLPLRGPLVADVGDVEQPGGAAKLLDGPRGPEQRGAYGVVDVVESVAAFAVVRPVPAEPSDRRSAS